MISEKRFISSPVYQLLSPLVSFLFLFFLLGVIISRVLIIPVLAFFLAFFLLNFGYLSFNLKEEGLFFSIKLFVFLIFDMLVVSFALILGGLLLLKGEKY